MLLSVLQDGHQMMPPSQCLICLDHRNYIAVIAQSTNLLIFNAVDVDHVQCVLNIYTR